MEDERYEEWDTGACYACGMTWLPVQGERHRRGCYRIEHPAGLLADGQCPECGTLPTPDQSAAGVSFTTDPCPNEGQCSRWRDQGAFEEDVPGDEPLPGGDLVSGVAEYVAAADDLDDLPF